jgi:hypothetical protein
MSKRVAIVVALAGVAVALLALLVLRKPAPLRETDLTGMAARFMTILPDELSAAQKAEIEGLLKRFFAKAEADQVRAEDYQEVMDLLAAHLSAGRIERRDLNLFMAKVGYYTTRAQTPDSLGIHPMLEPIDSSGQSE